MTQPREMTIEWRGLSLAALAWGSQDQPKILALHGWMDNAASFIPLASSLDGFHIVAPDFVGHGLSDHRPHSCGAHFIDWVADVLGMAEVLGWREFSILGHSMGAAIGAQTAAVSPETIQRLVLLDGFGPLSDPAEEAPARLAKALDAERRQGLAEDPPCRTLEAAIKARLRSGSDLTPEGARLLVERGTEPCADGVRFRHDPRLRLPSRTRLTEEQVLAFLRGVSCPVLAIRPRGGWPVPEDIINRRLGAFSDLSRIEVDGGHHVHLTHPERVADAVAVAAAVGGRGRGLRMRSRFAVRGPPPRLLSSIPGLRVRFAPPLGPFPQGASVSASEELRPLRKTTSTAYGGGRDSIAKALAVGCPVRHSSRASPVSGGLPGEEGLTPHAPLERGAL